MNLSQLEQLLTKLTDLQSVMENVSTGQSRIQEEDTSYKNLYAEIGLEIRLLQEDGVEIYNPNQFRSLWDWYKYWSENLPNYSSRREYIRTLYSSINIPIEALLQKHKHQSIEPKQIKNELNQQIQLNNLQSNSPYLSDEISSSLAHFYKDHPASVRTAFIMMKFSKTKAHQEIDMAIKNILSQFDIRGLRADDKEYHDDLFSNIRTYMHGCEFGIAVFERIEADEFNPNVSLEVGYMLALKKSVCLLKDQTLRSLHTDLTGKLYKTFDPQDISVSISRELTKWLKDKIKHS